MAVPNTKNYDDYPGFASYRLDLCTAPMVSESHQMALEWLKLACAALHPTLRRMADRTEFDLVS
jgi:hypothetical protein